MAQLSTLLNNLFPISRQSDLSITGLTMDSRLVKPGDLFIAYAGQQTDGRLFIDQAIRQGAAAVIAEASNERLNVEHSTPVFYIPHLKTKVGEIAARFYDYPARALEIVGVTGTNGKTSCTHLIAQILSLIHQPCGVVGTLGNGIYGALEESQLTTPDAIQLQKLFAEFVYKKIHYVAMEVSSHSLDQARVACIPFKIGIFTTLTRDHLDYHGSMEAYGAAKKKLFMEYALPFAVINADDPFGQTLIQAYPQPKNLYTYGLKPAGAQNEIGLSAFELTKTGIKAELQTPWGEGQLTTPLIGLFNLSNLLAVVTSLCLMDIPLQTVLACITEIKPVLGRMQLFGGHLAPLVVVDYAHTPDALEKALSALKAHCRGQLYCIFGCGGERDKGKRSLMAQVAEKLADHVIVTNDNPRTEDPDQIIDQIMIGFSKPAEVMIQQDRSKAIHDVIQYAQQEDCILIAGKGAENYQYIGTHKIPFSDIEKVKENLNARLAQ